MEGYYFLAIKGVGGKSWGEGVEGLERVSGRTSKL